MIDAIHIGLAVFGGGCAGAFLVYRATYRLCDNLWQEYSDLQFRHDVLLVRAKRAEAELEKHENSRAISNENLRAANEKRRMDAKRRKKLLAVAESNGGIVGPHLNVAYQYCA